MPFTGECGELARFLVVHLKLDTFGGAERVCHHILKTLIEHDQEVELLSFAFDRNKYRKMIGEEIPRNVTVHELHDRFNIAPPFTIYKEYFLAKKVLSKFKERLNSKYDFIFLTQASNPFELNFLTGIYNRSIGYVHFPEIHFEYDRSGLGRKTYLWLFKYYIEKGVSKLNWIICNSFYTREMITKYWGKHNTKNTTVIYPPVDLDAFWCTKSFDKREKRVVYIGRFTPGKGHKTMKDLAENFPEVEFISIGALTKDKKRWFEDLSANAPRNYLLKPNLPRTDLIRILQNSKIYIHLMKGEHFGIAPIEALASGCIVLVHDSGGAREYIPRMFRWKNFDDLKSKLSYFIEIDEKWWSSHRDYLWQKIMKFNSSRFSDEIWQYLKGIIEN